MSQRGTVIILGAGASYSSAVPEAKLPLQKGFFACVASSNFVPQQMVLEAFLEEPFRTWLNNKGYGEPYNSKDRLTNDYSINLEDFYSEIESDYGIPSPEKYRILEILDRIIFESIALPIVSLRNDPNKVCPTHKRLVNLLKPGDTIINFNYDCLADDALLHFCPYWHPLTGHGIKFDDVFGGSIPIKAKIFQSSVSLLKPHGSVTFRYRIDSNKTLIRLVALVSGIQPLPMPMTGGWEPFIVPPSSSKIGHHQYMKEILSLAKMKLDRAKKVVVVGYSFPSNDSHIRKMMKGVRGDLILVNPSLDSSEYRARLKDIGFTKYEGFKSFEEFIQNNSI